MTKKKRVMGFGTFDAVHPGHVFYLEALSELGDELFVVIARDSSVRRIKGIEPHFSELERQEAIRETGIADMVLLGSETDFFQVLRDHEPDVLGFGYDQRVPLDELEEAFPELEIVRIEAHFPEKYKSSIIKKQMGS